MSVFILGSLILVTFILVVVFRRRNHALARQVEAAEKKMDATEQALKGFTAAIADYAQHLSSHTGAIHGLAEASQELKKSAAFQNSVILDLIKNTENAIVQRESLLKTVKLDIAPARAAPKKKGKPAWEIAPPSYRSLHRAQIPLRRPGETTRGERTVFEAANLVEAMVLPYYRALYRLEKGNSPPADVRAQALAKKSVEAIMFPSYRTLHPVKPEKPSTEKLLYEPPTDGTKKPGSPYHSRRRHPLMPW